MVKIDLSVDMSGYAYDPEQPTKEAERLCFRLNAILDKLAAEGYEIRLVEPSDVSDAETFNAGLFAALNDGTSPVTLMDSPSNMDMMLDPSVSASVYMSRTAWLRGILEKRTGVDPSVVLARIEEIYKLSLNKEQAIYLSDGTPIYCSSGLIG